MQLITLTHAVVHVFQISIKWPDTYECTSNSYGYIYDTARIVYIALMMYIIPLIIMGTNYLHIAFALWKNKKLKDDTK